ncbi:MAG: NAD-dependent epimerase/dehydratase family protein [Firmicutes bacterium]|nr:NAD-dependent epimerase/dehydratase family protein [Bacillota bacterium]
MRALVTGGAGFIGSHLVETLLARGWQVAVLDNFATGRRENVPEDAVLFEADVRDQDAVARAVADFRPTHIFHQAAQASVKVSVDDPALDAAINVMGGLSVLEAARRSGVRRVVVASTGGAIYGEVPEGQRASEEWPLRPKSPYGVAKAALEQYLEAYRQNFGLAGTVLRYANVYGPRQDPLGEAGVVAIFANRVLGGRPVTLFARREPGDEGCVRDYVWVGDVVAANLLAAERELDGCFNVGTGVGSTTRQVLAAIEAAAGARARVEPAPPRPGDLERSVVDASRLAACGWSPRVGLEEGIRRTVEWFRRTQNGN